VQLPPEAIKEFQDHWQAATGEILQYENATVQALKLLNVLETVFTDEPSTKL
jgi:hypothetical protein